MGKRTRALEKLMEAHNNAMKRALRWARNHGAEVDKYDIERVGRNTHVKFCIYHANDTIEVGSLFADKEDNMWSMYSEEDFTFKVHNENVSMFLKHVSNHRSIGKGRIDPKIEIDTDVGNQYVMHKRLEIGGFNDYSYTNIRLTFHIYHIKEVF